MEKTRKRRKRNKKKPWYENEELLKRMVIVVSLSIPLVIGGSIFIILNLRSGGHSIDLEISPIIAETGAIRGVPFDLEISINNQTGGVLEEANLQINLSSGLISMEFGNDDKTIKENVGNIGKNTLIKRVFKIMPIGELGSQEKVSVSLSYAIGRTKFEKNASSFLEIKEKGIELEIQQPAQAIIGSSFEIVVYYKNNSDIDFDNLALEMNYPPSFNFLSAELEPYSFNNYWRLGTLKAGSTGKLKIKGRLENDTGSLPELKASLLIDLLGKSYKIADGTTKIKTAPSPIDLKVTISGNPNYTVKIGETIRYDISYTNRSGIILKEVQITARFAGELFDFNTLQSDAKVSFGGRVLVWDKTTNPSLKMVKPGESGVVSATISLEKIFPIRRLSDTNFVLKANVEIESPSVPYYLQAEKTTAVTTLETKVEGLITIDAQVFYRDAASGIVNLGSLPPRVGSPTQYTIHWVVRNYTTDVRDVKIKATLPEGVKWTGIVKSNIDSVPLYQEETRSVVWEIEKIQATKGIVTPPVEAIFQIEATPSLSMVGQFQPLLTKTDLTAFDEFTGRTLTSSDVPLTTALSEDLTVGPAHGIVIK